MLATLRVLLYLFPAVNAERPTITFVPPVTFERRANVNVSWSHMHFPHGNRSNYYIAAFSPPSFPLAVKLSKLNSERGTRVFNLLNIRKPYVFRILHGEPEPEPYGPPYMRVIAESEFVYPDALPMQLRTCAWSNSIQCLV